MPSLLYYARQVRALGLSESFRQGRALIANRTSAEAEKAYERLFGPAMDKELARLRRRLSSSPDIADRIRSRETPAFFLQSPEFYRLALNEHFPDESAKIIEAAELGLRHVVDLLGSGPTNLDAFARAGAGLPWHLDFKSGYAWDPRTFYSKIRITNRPGTDIKVPWELSRFQHLLPMGEAYFLTGDERYPREFVRQVLDWIAHNPCRYGVNWTCTMDVGIRAVNWIWGFFFFRHSRELTGIFIREFLFSLHAHARHIRSNLEFRMATVRAETRRLNSNHYLSNLAGLLYIALLFPELELQDNLDFARKEFEIELFEQTYEDGVDYEHSTSYHRLVTEIFVSSFRLLALNGFQVSSAVDERLMRMAEYIADYQRPDGSSPQAGDADNGRLHPLSVRSVADHRYLPLMAADAYGREDLRIVDRDPEALWWAGAVPARPANPRSRSAAYAGNRFTILRSADTHVFISAATVGMHGRGSHSHNDLLSFEYWRQGQAWVVDPGTYVYTADSEARNLFRSTASHNTVRIDGAEINPFTPGQLFQLPDAARVTVIRWETSDAIDAIDAIDEFEAEHTGYFMLERGRIKHRRHFRFEKHSGDLEIQDFFEVSGSHRFEWFFHTAPDVRVESVGRHFHLYAGGRSLTLSFEDSERQCNNTEGWYSPSYGVRQKASVICAQCERATSFSVTTRIAGFSG